VEAEFEKLAYEAALRSLDKQETYVEELRARTGVLLAASSLAASFLGQQAFQSPGPRGLVIAALLAFVVSIGMDVFILLPKQGLVFAQTGPGLYEDGFLIRDDMPEVYRRLTYQLHEFWKANDAKIERLIRAFAVAAAVLVVEILALAALLGGNLLSS
jgi:tetrahydromethanopterin S-methyltransferase subunit B